MSDTTTKLESFLTTHPRFLSAAFGGSLLLSQAVVSPFGNGGVIS